MVKATPAVGVAVRTEADWSVDETVWANASAAIGLPYRARIEAIRGDRACVRPLEVALTAGGARSQNLGRHGPSIRARWVKLSTLQKIGASD